MDERNINFESNGLTWDVTVGFVSSQSSNRLFKSFGSGTLSYSITADSIYYNYYPFKAGASTYGGNIKIGNITLYSFSGIADSSNTISNYTKSGNITLSNATNYPIVVTTTGNNSVASPYALSFSCTNLKIYITGKCLFPSNSIIN